MEPLFYDTEFLLGVPGGVQAWTIVVEVSVVAENPLSVSDLSACILAACVHNQVRVVCEPGEVLLRQGERSDSVYFVEEGLCKLVWRTPEGLQVLAGLRPSGWPVGSVDGLLSREAAYSAECVGSCVVRQVPLRLFLRRLSEVRVVNALLQVHAFKVAQARHMHLMGLASLRARTRVIMLLKWLHSQRIAIRHETDAVSIAGTLKHSEMAGLVAMLPETFARVLGGLERDGVIARRNGWITLLGSEPRSSQRQRPVHCQSGSHPTIAYN